MVMHDVSWRTVQIFSHMAASRFALNSLRKISSCNAMDKVYELRCYKIHPHCLKPFLGLTAEHLHLRTAHSKLIGYWTSELGGLNEVVHIWEYDSLEHRAGVRAALATDPKWISDYFSKILPMMSAQENSVCEALNGTEIAIPEAKKGSAYNLVTLDFKGPKAKWETSLRALLKEVDEAGHLVGTFVTLHGRVNQVVLLVQHTSLSQGAQLVQKLNSVSQEAMWANLDGAQSKLMLPFVVSPLQ